MATVLHVAASRTMPEMTFENFQKIPGLTIQQMILAFRQVGLKIGFFQLEPAVPVVIESAAEPADETTKPDAA